MTIDLSTQQQHDLPEWLLTDGGYLIFAKDDRPGWTLLWPTKKKEPGEGLTRSREEAVRVVRQLVSQNVKAGRPVPEIVVLRISREQLV